MSIICEICSKWTINTSEPSQWSRSAVFIVNFENILHIVMVFPFWIVEQVSASCVLLWEICQLCNRCFQEQFVSSQKQLSEGVLNKNCSIIICKIHRKTLAMVFFVVKKKLLKIGVLLAFLRRFCEIFWIPFSWNCSGDCLCPPNKQIYK